MFDTIHDDFQLEDRDENGNFIFDPDRSVKLKWQYAVDFSAAYWVYSLLGWSLYETGMQWWGDRFGNFVARTWFLALILMILVFRVPYNNSDFQLWR